MGCCITEILYENDENDEHKDRDYKSYHSLNNLYVIGYNDNYELGLMHRRSVKTLTDFSTVNPKLIINQIHNGDQHTMFVDIDGKYWSSGYSQNLQYYSRQCLKINSFDFDKIKIKKISMNMDGCNTFWITDKNILYGDGNNDSYQLGLSDNKYRYKPEMIASLKNVIDATGGRDHSLAICASGTDSNINKIRIIIRNWDKIYIPNAIILIIKNYYTANYMVYSTGQCSVGQDGHGSNKINRNKWRIIDAFKYEAITNISAGSWHSLFLDETGLVWSSGRNFEGQLGIGDDMEHSSDPPKPIPFFITNKINVIQIECGMFHNLCIDSNGGIYSWGLNKNGQCGVGTTESVLKPKLIEPLSDINIIAIKCGKYHSYAKSQHAAHFLFGDNEHNQCSLRELDKDLILVPFCINATFSEITNGARIDNVYLGNNNTFIICNTVNKTK